MGGFSPEPSSLSKMKTRRDEPLVALGDGAPCLLGRTTIERIHSAFAVCELATRRDAAAAVPVALFVAACGATVDLYAHVFSPGSFIARVLGRTTTRHMACVSAAVARFSAGGGGGAGGGAGTTSSPSLRAVLVRERDERGLEGVRWDRVSACHTAMWLSRGLYFCQTFMDLLANGDGGDSLPSPRACASTAYNRALRPYHGLLLSTVFRAALTYAPAEREDLFRASGYEDLSDGEARVRACVEAMRPVTRRVHRLIVDEGLDFPDVVSPLRGALR